MSEQYGGPVEQNPGGERVVDPGAQQFDAAPDPGREPVGGPEQDPERRAKRGRLIARLCLAAATVVVLALAAGAVAILSPRVLPVGAASDLPSNGLESWSRSDDRLGLSQAWLDLNQAMADGDREAFLSFADEGAREPLARWWDGTKAIGWDLGYAIPGARFDEGSNEPIDQLTLGAQLAFSAEADRGSGVQSAGLKLTQTFAYDVVYSVDEEEELKIASLEPTADSWMPWDDGEVYVAKGEHVVLFGMKSEQALIDATIGEAEASAELALETVRKLGGDPPVDGFVAAITDDPEAFSRWYGTDQAVFEVAGIAKTTPMPSADVLEIDSEIATGDGNSGMLVTMSPASRDDRTSTFVHEFGHVIQQSAVPGESTMQTHRAEKMEGFARFFENTAGVGPGYFRDPRTAENILNLGEGALSETIFNSDDTHLFYSAAGSYYQFVADTGGDPWKIALRANSIESLVGLGEEQGAQFGVAQWQDWVRQQG